MKKCPECGNPSYDGAPVCGNCGYTFPKPKGAVHKEESVFDQPQKAKKDKSSESTGEILKRNKLVIGIIVFITLIVICGIVLTGSGKNSSPIVQINDLNKYNDSIITFDYPKNWEKLNMTDEEHNGGVFFKNDNNTIIEYYNVTSDATSLKEINQQRIIYAQESGDYLECLETITIDGRNSSDMIFENADGNYTRYVTMFSDGELYVFKMSGDSVNSLTAQDMQTVLDSVDLL